MAKYTELTPALYGYMLQQRSGAGDPLLARLRAETETLGDDSRMQISDEQGSFLTILAAASGAASAIEIGTFTGYSSICIARGLKQHGRLICIDESAEWTSIARRYWQEAGVAHKIDLRVGKGPDLLAALEPGLKFDFVFIDADKTGYDGYYEAILPRVRQDGILLFDNMLAGGRIIKPDELDDRSRALDSLNKKLAADPRVECALLPIADGIQFCRKR